MSVHVTAFFAVCIAVAFAQPTASSPENCPMLHRSSRELRNALRDCVMASPLGLIEITQCPTWSTVVKEAMVFVQENLIPAGATSARVSCTPIIRSVRHNQQLPDAALEHPGHTLVAAIALQYQRQCFQTMNRRQIILDLIVDPEDDFGDQLVVVPAKGPLPECPGIEANNVVAPKPSKPASPPPRRALTQASPPSDSAIQPERLVIDRMAKLTSGIPLQSEPGVVAPKPGLDHPQFLMWHQLTEQLSALISGMADMLYIAEQSKRRLVLPCVQDGVAVPYVRGCRSADTYFDVSRFKDKVITYEEFADKFEQEPLRAMTVCLVPHLKFRCCRFGGCRCDKLMTSEKDLVSVPAPVLLIKYCRAMDHVRTNFLLPASKRISVKKLGFSPALKEKFDAEVRAKFPKYALFQLRSQLILETPMGWKTGNPCKVQLNTLLWCASKLQKAMEVYKASNPDTTILLASDLPHPSGVSGSGDFFKDIAALELGDRAKCPPWPTDGNVLPVVDKGNVTIARMPMDTLFRKITEVGHRLWALADASVTTAITGPLERGEMALLDIMLGVYAESLSTGLSKDCGVCSGWHISGYATNMMLYRHAFTNKKADSWCNPQ